MQLFVPLHRNRSRTHFLFPRRKVCACKRLSVTIDTVTIPRLLFYSEKKLETETRKTDSSFIGYRVPFWWNQGSPQDDGKQKQESLICGDWWVTPQNQPIPPNGRRSKYWPRDWQFGYDNDKENVKGATKAFNQNWMFNVTQAIINTDWTETLGSFPINFDLPWLHLIRR